MTGKRRRVIERTCIGCQAVRDKRTMIRIVRTPDGGIRPDPTGRAAGRGAYICPDPGCLEGALKGRRLERHLRRPVSAEVVQALREEISRYADPPSGRPAGDGPEGGSPGRR